MIMLIDIEIIINFLLLKSKKQIFVVISKNIKIA